MKQKTSNILLAVFVFHLVITIASGNSLHKTWLEKYRKCLNDNTPDKRHCVASFNELDTNGDGRISKEESEPFIEKLAKSYAAEENPNPEDSPFAEMMAALIADQIKGYLTTFFDEADENGDGKITLDEFKNATKYWKLKDTKLP
ncbi:uncharacterized protein [Diabrotica undecimpunctata]|uniref:uncharacterized protein n=1 Tax=Diabrotica undecimpunctata TaxID=50387 RepID=UPI003B6400A8